MSSDFKVGQLCYSKNGRDRGVTFIVIKVEDDYVYLVNGERRTLDRPKRKKIKHVQIINSISSCVLEHMGNKDLLDSHIRKAIKEHTNKVGV
ncbi:MAG: hypothetical protein ACK5LT_08965 [Lachnospirales bacterium]